MNTYYAMLDRDREPWTEHEDALLGTDTDRAIAAKLGRSTVSVGNRRVKLGISAFVKRRRNVLQR
jgi:hypothetical protein